MPSDKIISRCFEANQNGAGIMYRNENKIHIKKGFMTVDVLKTAITEIGQTINLKKTDVCLHFRISTTGSSIPQNCHPFPLSNNIDDLKSLEIITDKGICHNGILTDYSKLHNEKTDLSDTMYFSKMLSGVNDRFLQNVISAHAINSRFCLMTARKTIVWGLINDKGLFYSNTSYKPSIAVNQYVNPYAANWNNYRYIDGIDIPDKDYRQTDLSEIGEKFETKDRKEFLDYLKKGSIIDLYSL